MRKFFAALAACLCVGALSNPVAAQRDDPDLSRSGALAADPTGTPNPKDHLGQQSRFDTGLRRVIERDAYCEPVPKGRAAQLAQDQEVVLRQTERRELKSLGTETSNHSVSSGSGEAQVHEFPRSWISSQVVQHVLRRLSTMADETPGLYGYEVNEAAETIVLVHLSGADLGSIKAKVSRLLIEAEDSIAEANSQVAASDLSELSASDQAAVRQDMAELNSVALTNVDITAEFRSTCRDSAGDLDAVEAAVTSFEWADQSVPEQFEIAVQQDLVAGVVEVVVESAGVEAASIGERLQQEFGADVELVVDPDHPVFADELVTSRDSVPGRKFQAGRYADKSPHLGGVQIGDWDFRRGACTSGFAVNLPDGGRAMLTAGHCKEYLPLNTALFSGLLSRSKTYNYFGTFYESYWTELDVGLIGSSSQKYRRKIYTDPDPSGVEERLITSVWEPWIGAKVCVSGSFTGNICGGEVIARSIGCIRGGTEARCGHQYTIERQDGRAMSQPGDSGAPVYLPHGSTGARALGIVSTGLGGQTSFLGSQAIHKATGGWIASACCDATTW